MTEIQLSRRGFIKGLVAVAAATQLPLPSFVPTLWGDGIHDDTAGLQALINGLDVIKDGVLYRRPPGNFVYIHEGIFKLSDTIRIANLNTSIFGATFTSTVDKPILELEADNQSVIYGCCFNRDFEGESSAPYISSDIHIDNWRET